MNEFSFTDADVSRYRLLDESPTEIHKFLSNVRRFFDSLEVSQYILYPPDSNEEFILDSAASEETKKIHGKNVLEIRKFFEKVLTSTLLEKYGDDLQRKRFRSCMAALDAKVGQVHKESREVSELFDIIVKVKESKNYLYQLYTSEHRFVSTIKSLLQRIQNMSDEKISEIFIKTGTDFISRMKQDNKYLDPLLWTHEQMLSQINSDKPSSEVKLESTALMVKATEEAQESTEPNRSQQNSLIQAKTPSSSLGIPSCPEQPYIAFFSNYTGQPLPLNNGHPPIILNKSSRNNFTRGKAQKQKKFTYSSSNINSNVLHKPYDPNLNCEWCGRIGHSIQDCRSKFFYENKQRQARGIRQSSLELGVPVPSGITPDILPSQRL